MPAYWLMALGADPGRVVLFLHGGSYKLGSVRSHSELAARLGRASGMQVLFPEYRLAPEHPFPAAFEDVLATWRWLHTDQGLGTASMAVAGDSAGAGLAVALLVALRDAREQDPGAAVLLSPWVDLTGSGVSMTERAAQDPIFTPDMLRQLAAAYLAGADPQSPFASPLFASLAGLPPLLVQVGTAELLLSDWRRQRQETMSPCRSARASTTSTRISSALPRPPRPASRLGNSCVPGSADPSPARTEASSLTLQVRSSCCSHW